MDPKSSFVVAIDGPAAAGKGTLARQVADRFELAFLDTGMLYRGVAWIMLDGGLDPENTQRATEIANSFSLAAIKGADIRTREVGSAASIVAANEGVRAALLAFQRNFAKTPPALENGGLAKGAVLDGRDIGTVVCPDASVKIFVTASSKERAHRRWLELKETNPGLAEESVLQDVLARDERDASRDTAPLVQADNAHLIDTTHLSKEAAFAAARALIEPFIS